MPDEGFIFSGEVERGENRHFLFFVLNPMFVTILWGVSMFFLFLLWLGGIIYAIINKKTLNFMFILITINTVGSFWAFIINFKIQKKEYNFSENSFKVTSQDKSGNWIKTYKKNEIKKILHKDGYIGIKVSGAGRGGYLIILDKFFNGKTRYNEFVKFLDKNYGDKIIHK
jgi:hypothetical protein